MRSNLEIAEHIEAIAELSFLAKEEQRGFAYSKAAASIRNATEQVGEDLKPGQLKFVGPSIIGVVKEFLASGISEKWLDLDRRVERAPEAIANELQKIPGVGPVKATQLWKAGYKTLSDVEAALASGALKDERLRKSVEHAKYQSARIPYLKALKIAYPILDVILAIKDANGRSLVEKADFAGSLRRKKETVKDIDILCSIATDWDRNLVREHLKATWPSDIIADGETRTRLRISDRQVDIIFTTPNTWGAALQYLTGSTDFNVRLRGFAKTLHWKISEYQMVRYFGRPDEKRVDVPSEETIFDLLGIWYVPPEQREGTKYLEYSIALRRLKGIADLDFEKAIWLRVNQGISNPEELQAYKKEIQCDG